MRFGKPDETQATSALRVLTLLRDCQPIRDRPDDKIASDFGNGPRPREPHREVDFLPQQLEHGAHPRFAVDRESPEHRPTDHYRTCAECDRLDDVSAAADATVDVDLRLATDRVDDFR